MTSLAERLDADLRGQLRRGRPLPVVMALSIGEPVLDEETAMTAKALSITPAEIVDCLAKAGATYIECKAQSEAPMLRPHATMRELLEIVSMASGISLGDLVSPRRSRDLARPRQVVMWLAKKHTRYSLPTIGRAIGNRDHTTVMHAVRRIASLLEAGDRDLAQLVQASEAGIDVLSKNILG